MPRYTAEEQHLVLEIATKVMINLACAVGDLDGIPTRKGKAAWAFNAGEAFVAEYKEYKRRQAAWEKRGSQ